MVNSSLTLHFLLSAKRLYRRVRLAWDSSEGFREDSFLRGLNRKQSAWKKKKKEVEAVRWEALCLGKKKKSLCVYGTGRMGEGWKEGLSVVGRASHGLRGGLCKDKGSNLSFFLQNFFFPLPFFVFMISLEEIRKPLKSHYVCQWKCG